MFHMFFVDNSQLERRVILASLEGLLALVCSSCNAYSHLHLNWWCFIRGEQKVCLKPNSGGRLGELLNHGKISQHV